LNSLVSINTSLNNKQARLESGTNIETINGESLLGAGNIEISSSPASKNEIIVNPKTSESYVSSSGSSVKSLDLSNNYIIASSSGFTNSYIYLDATVLDRYSKTNQYTECKILWDDTDGVELSIGTCGLCSKFYSDNYLSGYAAEASNDMVDSNIYIPEAITKANTAGSKIEITIRSYGQISRSSKTYNNYPISGGYIVGTGLAHKHYITWQKLN
jgi:hypothetical protein